MRKHLSTHTSLLLFGFADKNAPFSISSSIRGLESQAAATLATQYNHLPDRILHLYLLLERNWQNVLSCVILNNGVFAFCFLTIYSWL